MSQYKLVKLHYNGKPHTLQEYMEYFEYCAIEAGNSGSSNELQNIGRRIESNIEEILEDLGHFGVYDSSNLRNFFSLISFAYYNLKSQDLIYTVDNTVLEIESKKFPLKEKMNISTVTALMSDKCKEIPSNRYTAFYEMLRIYFVEEKVDLDKDWCVFQVFKPEDANMWPVPKYIQEYKALKKTLTNFDVRYWDIKTISVDNLYGKFQFVKEIDPNSLMPIKLSLSSNEFYYSKDDFLKDIEAVKELTLITDNMIKDI